MTGSNSVTHRHNHSLTRSLAMAQWVSGYWLYVITVFDHWSRGHQSTSLVIWLWIMISRSLTSIISSTVRSWCRNNAVNQFIVDMLRLVLLLVPLIHWFLCSFSLRSECPRRRCCEASCSRRVGWLTRVGKFASVASSRASIRTSNERRRRGRPASPVKWLATLTPSSIGIGGDSRAFAVGADIRASAVIRSSRGASAAERRCTILSGRWHWPARAPADWQTPLERPSVPFASPGPWRPSGWVRRDCSLGDDAEATRLASSAPFGARRTTGRRRLWPSDLAHAVLAVAGALPAADARESGNRASVRAFGALASVAPGSPSSARSRKRYLVDPASNHI